MEVTYTATNLGNSAYKINVVVDEIAECPMCKKSIKPVHLNSVYHCFNNNYFMETQLLCKGCGKSFISHHLIAEPDSRNNSWEISLSYIAPNEFVKAEFDNFIYELSPQFVKIYNQALAAECSSLDEIAGLGFRKSLEFLVKDFAISEHPDAIESIKSMNLSQCISNYISDPNIKTLATRSAWIGNDEAHYIKKQEDRDVSDMKKFIQAIIYFISMILITKDANSMEPK